MIDFWTYGLYLSAFLFCIGFIIIITKRTTIFVLFGVELILNGANLNLVIFSRQDPSLQGQVFGVFTVVIAAAEAAVALALLLNLYKHYRTSNIDQLNELGN